MTSTQPRHRGEHRPMSLRLPLLVVLLLAVIASVAVTGSSSATYVSTTSSTGTVTAAADWTPPTVSVAAPASPLKGTVTITASAADATSGIDTVTIQRAAAGSTAWTSLCTTRTSPYTCGLDTTTLTDGAYDLRAVAVDKAGVSTTSATVRATVANALVVVLTDPGSTIRGTATLTTTVSNTGSLTPTVRVEYAPTGTTTWTTLCTVSAAPYTCSINTSGGPNGTYDIRSIAVAGGTSYTSAVVSRIVVDNLAPTVTMTDPGTPIRGTKTFTATASDAHSGVARVVIQSTTGSAWTDLCPVTAAPYSCSVDTGTLANGTYSFRAVATDRAGNTTTSTPVTGRVVQNTVSTITMSTPATRLRGTVMLAASVTTNGTLSTIRFQRSPAGAATWTDLCAGAASASNPNYNCSFATTGVDDGTYDLRATVTDSNGRATASPVVANRIVDNTAGRGVDVQTTNGGTAGRVDAGDTMVLTFSEQMNLSSILSGWSGSAVTGSVQVSGGDVLDLVGPNGAELGTVALGADFASRSTTSTAVSMTAANVTGNGLTRTVVTLRVTGGSIGNQVTTPATMSWTPSATILDLAGNPTSAAAVAESGSVDLDF
ncbi:MAG: Ig-like domain-containing protein [Aeromicrobium sp.]